MSKKDYRHSSEYPGVVQEGLSRVIPQFLVYLVKKEGGQITIPVEELDKTGDSAMVIEADTANRSLILRTVPKRSILNG